LARPQLARADPQLGRAVITPQATGPRHPSLP
jgi:hypothetical protein